MARIEHVNFMSRDPGKLCALLIDLFDWKLRWSGKTRDGGHTIHVGRDDQYLAIYAPPPGAALPDADRTSTELRHIGVLVGDLDAIERRVVKLGLSPFGHADYEPGRRFYFTVPEGIEFEVVSYQ